MAQLLEPTEVAESSITELAYFGGAPAVHTDYGDIFRWPIITAEDEAAALDVLRRGAMSGIDVTQKFEQEFASWQGLEYALAFNNGTAALLAAMFGCEIGVGDEIICPSITYWASALPCFSLGATVVFADVDPKTLCIDPDDIARHMSPRTKAIVAVHYLGHPAAIDRITEIARRHQLKVIEDVSHAQGGLYKGRKLGTWGDVAAMSLMSGKSFAIGEGGMLATGNRKIYERALAFGHYERFNGRVEDEFLKPFAGLPLGGYKNRMHQVSSAVGRVQLKYYDQRCREIRRAMNYFWDLLEGTPGLRAHRITDPDSNMAGWYHPGGLYHPEELGGLTVSRFCDAVRAEGTTCSPGGNFPLHRHSLFNECDIYSHGVPTRIANSTYDLRQPVGSLPISERINEHTLTVPWFKHYRPAIIEEHAAAFRKVAENYEQLLEGDTATTPATGKVGLWLAR